MAKVANAALPSGDFHATPDGPSGLPVVWGGSPKQAAVSRGTIPARGATRYRYYARCCAHMPCTGVELVAAAVTCAPRAHFGMTMPPCRGMMDVVLDARTNLSADDYQDRCRGRCCSRCTYGARRARHVAAGGGTAK